MRKYYFYAYLKTIHFIGFFFWVYLGYGKQTKTRFKLSNLLKKVLPNLESFDSPFLCHTIFDFDLFLDKYGGHWVYYLGFYELGTLKVIQNCLKKGEIFVDVGSSIGLMSMMASNVVGNHGRVLAFEPSKERFNSFVKTIKHYKIQNVSAFDFGLGNKNAEIRLFVDGVSPSMVQSNDNELFNIVRIKSLAQVLKDLEIKKINLIKIDVEGFELEVLKGAAPILRSKEAPIICVEFIKNIDRVKRSTSTDLFNYLKKVNSYYFFQFEETSHMPSRLRSVETYNQLNEKDNLYCFLDSHLKSLKKKSLFRTYG